MQSETPKILIVDDERFNIEVLVGFLEMESYDLSYVTNGENALKVAFSEPFDLILLDINMPGIDGFETCRRLKADTATAEVPVIFISALNDIEAITRAFENGGVDYISKPFNGMELLARVRTHLKIRQYARELQEKQRRLAQIASTDSLTGLPNRLHFVSTLRQQTANMGETQGPLSVICLTIDHLYRLNGIYGYESGDRVLVQSARQLSQALRPQDFIARLGGTEFGIILPQTSLQSAAKLASKLHAELKKVRALPTQLSGSFATVSYHAGESHDSLIKRAETLMHKVKEHGGDNTLIETYRG